MANQVSSLHLRSDSTCGSNQNQFANQFSQFPFSPEQCQKLLAMIGGHDPQSTPIVMANNVSFPSHQPTPMASNHFMSQTSFDLKNFIFAAKVVNRTTFEC